MPKRLLFIGAGGLAHSRAACFARIAGVELAGVVSRTEASARRLAEAHHMPAYGTDLEAVAARVQPDAVSIASINAAHHQHIMWALEHDLDVFVEGPMVVSAAQAEQVATLAQARGRIVEVGFQRRYHPTIQRARDFIQNKHFGPLIYGEVEFFWHMAPPPGQPASWYLDDTQSGGMAVCHMSYGLNTLRWVLGDPQRVVAAGSSLGFPPGQVDSDTLSATLLYDSGAVGHIIASFVTPEGFPSGMMKVFCPEGGLAVQILHEVCGTFWEGNDVVEIAPVPRVEGGGAWGGDDLQAQCEAFVRALETRQGLLNPPEDSAFELRLIEGALESARTRQPVELA